MRVDAKKYMCICCKKKRNIENGFFVIEEDDQDKNKPEELMCMECFCKSQRQKMSKNGT